MILVDDGSTDRSGELCEEYEQKDSRVRVIHIENSGTFQARKVGAKIAKGDILTFSDADDWLEIDAFETVMEMFYKYDPDILAYAYECEGMIEKHLYEERLYCAVEIRNHIIPEMMYDSAVEKRRLNPSLCCKWIKKELFAKVTESVKDRITLGEDALVSYPAVCMAKSLFICNKALYHYSPNNFSCTHIYPLERIIEVKAFQDNIIRLFDGIGVLDRVRYQVEIYVRSFLAMLIENWYGIELSPVSFSFPYNTILKNSAVFIYGAGKVGKSYINELKLTNYAMIVGWADKNYKSIKEYNGMNVMSPEEIKMTKFDVILIAVRNEEISKAITRDLIDMGIPEEKIIWAKPMRIIWR